MNIQFEQSGTEGSFFIDKDSQRIAEARFAINGSEMDLYHTQVNEQYQGEHLGNLLIDAAVEYARKNDIKIYPSCRFAQVVFGRKKEYRDVLAK